MTPKYIIGSINLPIYKKRGDIPQLYSSKRREKFPNNYK